MVRIVGLAKRFGERTILSGIGLTVESGQVHALLGANGAGKSSIVKILAGYYSRDAGEIAIGGVAAPPSSGVTQMAALGVRVVHQDLGLVDGISILENVAIGGGYVRGRLGQVRWRATAERVTEALKIVGLDLPLDDDVERLPTWQRVGIACARALYDGLEVVRLLILDEVTAALPRGEVVRILGIVRRLRAQGAGILYVTHRFEEVIELADWVSILRNGTMFESRPIGRMTAMDLVEGVVGHRVLGERRPVLRRECAQPVLQLNSISTSRLRDISLTIHAGEICGVIGRAGCGRSALGRTIFGQEAVVHGTMRLDGQPFDHTTPSRSIQRGVAYVPQDRQRSGILPTASIRENLSITSLGAVSRFGIVNSIAECRFAETLIDRYAIKPADTEMDIGNLSGGNQQKAIVGRWGVRDMRLFILDEPTEGVDAGARESIYRFVRERSKGGAAVLLLSSSIEEIVETCDRVILLRDGEIAEEISGDRMSVKEIERCLIAGA